MKPTKTNLSKYYGITTRTLRNWELSTDGREKIYEAIKAYYIAHQERGNR